MAPNERISDEGQSFKTIGKMRVPDSFFVPMVLKQTKMKRMTMQKHNNSSGSLNNTISSQNLWLTPQLLRVEPCPNCKRAAKANDEQISNQMYRTIGQTFMPK